MWSAFTENAKKGFSDATKNFSDATKNWSEAMEKAGDSITQAAAKAGQNAAKVAKKGGNAGSSATSASASKDDAAHESKPTGSRNNQPDDSNPASSSSSASVQEPTSNNVDRAERKNSIRLPNVDKEKLFTNLKMGWSSVLQTTKRSMEATEEAIKMQQYRLEQNLPFGPGKRPGHFYKRDPKLPLDVEALRDAEVVYITDRIITMGHPATPSNHNPNITAERKLAAIAHLLQRRHDGRYLVWNLSEVNYEMSILDDQVLAFSFPGSPAPPLGLLLKLLVSMENWMKADERNVAVVHCLTGKGRTSTVLAAFLCWMGEAGFSDINQALTYIARCKKIPPEVLTIPSQRRYASYFKNMLDGVRPSQPPILLKRIIMSEAPKYAKGPPRENPEGQDGKNTGVDADDVQLMGCAPYLQIFKGGQLLFTTAATLHLNQKHEELPFVQGVDGPVPFHVEQIVQGDILIRCRHLTFKKQRISMFRAAFHTGYVPPNVMRLTKSQLDGACSDSRFSDDFFLDFIFEKVDAETATKHLEEEAAAAHAEEEEAGDGIEGKESKKKKQAAIVKASMSDTMLQGESTFWDVIATRRKANASRTDQDPNFGPNIGRRRGNSGQAKKAEEGKSSDSNASTTGVPSKERTQLETFSIGGEFDFLPDRRSNAVPQATVAVLPPEESKKDSLMEALDALDEDELVAAAAESTARIGTETVVFEHVSANNSAAGGEETETQDGSVSVATEQSQQQQQQQRQSDGSQSQATGQEETSSASKSGNETGDVASRSDLDDMEAMLSMGDVDLGDFNLDSVDAELEDLENLLKL